MNMKKAALSIALAAGMVSGSAFAANDGLLGTGVGATSTGDLIVNLNVQQQIQITGFADLTMTQQPSGDFTATDGLCAYRNITGNYSVQASSANGTGTDFRVTDGAGSFVIYDVDWTDANAVTTNLDHAVSSGALGNNAADFLDATCGAADNTTIDLVSTAAQVNAATNDGNHTDTLTVTITAE